MKTSLKTILVVMVVALAVAVFTACGIDPQPTTPPACEHAGGKATCKDAAVCEKCGESYGEKLAHSIVVREAEEATCTEEGITEGSFCSECGEVFAAQEVVPAKGHTEAIDAAVEATCTATGLTEGKHCSVCEEVLVAQTEIPVKAHTYDEDKWDADCNVCGTVRTCAHDGEKIKVEGKAATCTEAGLTNGEKCAICGDVTKNQEAIDAKGHTEVVDVAVAADCTNAGKTEGKHCSVCNEVLVAQKEVAALGHKEETIPGREATCTAAGLTEGKKCSVCGEIILAQTIISAKGHTEVIDAAVAPDCTNSGKTEGKHCSVCNEVLVAQEVVAPKGHKDENGDFDCDVCGTDLCTDHVPAAAVEENRVESTCTVKGSYDSVIKCSRCGEEISRDKKELPLAAHKEETIPAKAPTCTETGLSEGKKCSVCGEITKEQETTPAAGHNEIAIPGKAATCTAKGLTEGKKCSICGEITKAQEEIATLPHTYDDGVVSDSRKTYTCVNGCGATQVKYLVTVNYLYLDGTLAAEADVLEYADGEFFTVNAKAVEGYVASHDYVKGHIFGAGKTITIYYSQVDVWDGTSVSASLAGSGTEEDPYLIQSAADFAYFAGKINAVTGAAGTINKVTTFKGQYFKMTKSIDLNGHNLIVGFHTGWNNYQGFFGTFDGNNCSIRGINVKPTTGTSSALFGCIAKEGTLKNLIVYGNTSGASSVGSVVAYQLGKVDNVTSYVTVTATGGTVGGVVANQEGSAGALTNCVNYGNVTSKTYIVGGIVGSGGATLENCVNWGNVQGASECIGGIAGTTKDKDGTYISGCYNYGSVATTAKDKGMVAGIAGKCLKPVSNCYNFGTITGVNTIGGIVGSTTKSITNCENHGTVNATSWLVGGIAGSADTGANVTGCKNYGDITSTADCVGGIIGSSKGIVSNCENYGTIKGTGRSAGIAYYSNGTIENCVNNGNVIGGWDLGGILAWVGDGQSATITNCTNNGNVTGSWNNGGIFGLAHDNAGTVTITGCTNNGHIKSTTGGQISIAIKAVITECVENGSWTKAE